MSIGNNSRSQRTAHAQARRRTQRALSRAFRSKKDIASASSSSITFWNGVFMGWEVVDTNLMQVQHSNGNTIRCIPTFYHVKNTGTWTPGTTIVTIMQYGNATRAMGIPIGDITLAPV